MAETYATSDELRRQVERLRQRLAEVEGCGGGDQLSEQELRHVAELHPNVLDHITNIFYSHTTDHVLTYISRHTMPVLGIPPEEALVRWTDLVTDHPVNRKGFEITQRAIDTGEKQDPYELQLRHADGSTVWVEVHEAPVVRNGKTVAIVGALTDITQRKRMEQLLRTELSLSLSLGTARTLEGVLARALDAALSIESVSGGGFYLFDEATGEFELVTHRGLSDAFLEKVRRIPATDVRAQKVTQRSDRPFEHADEDTTGEGLSVAAVLPVRHEGKLVACLNVASRTFDSFPPPVFDALETIASQVGPVISRLKAEKSLQQSEAMLRGVFRAAPAGIGLVSNRIFQWVNEHLTRMTGYAEEELLGKSARMLYPSQEEFERVGREKYILIDATGAGSLETVWQRKDGRLLDVFLSSSALDQENLEIGVVFTAWDITERKQAEEERRRLQAQVQHAQKLESLGVLAGGVAHDFNNILHVILGNANLAAKHLPPESRALAYLTEVTRSVERAAGLCSQMLAYSGKGGLEIRRIHLGDVVRDIAGMLEVSISKKATLDIEVASDLPAIEADASQIPQIAMNLITNASEALGNRSGRIRLVIDAAHYDVKALRKSFPGRSLPAGTYVRLAVSDDGIGMDAETKQRIFEPFFTTKFTGRGLGMAAVLGIVRGHGGAIRVESAPNEGTMITVLFPAAEGAADAAPEEEGDAATATGSGTVLFVDDETAVRSLGQAMLQDAGYSVLLAADGREAVRMFRKHRDRITAVVLDLKMPEMDGEETLHVLRGIRPSVPVILCSGYTEQELRERLGTDGPSGFLKKPFAMKDLTAALADVLKPPAND